MAGFPRWAECAVNARLYAIMATNSPLPAPCTYVQEATGTVNAPAVEAPRAQLPPDVVDAGMWAARVRRVPELFEAYVALAAVPVHGYDEGMDDDSVLRYVWCPRPTAGQPGVVDASESAPIELTATPAHSAAIARDEPVRAGASVTQDSGVARKVLVYKGAKAQPVRGTIDAQSVSAASLLVRVAAQRGRWIRVTADAVRAGRYAVFLPLPQRAATSRLSRSRRRSAVAASRSTVTFAAPSDSST